jgi:hypothetical protein
MSDDVSEGCKLLIMNVLHENIESERYAGITRKSPWELTKGGAKILWGVNRRLGGGN